MKVFFIGYEQADVPFVAPVMLALAKRDGWEPVFVPGLDFKEQRGCLALATGPPGIAVRRLQDELPPCESAAARRCGLGLRAAALGRAKTAAADGTFDARLLGTSLSSLLERPYAPELFEAYAECEAALHALARRERPRLVVLPEDTDYLRGRLAARVLRAYGATMVCLLPFFYSVFSSYPLVGERHADRYLVTHRSFADRLAGQGIAAERIEVVGNPAFDALGEASELAEGSAQFLYALQDVAWEREIVEDLVAIFRDLPAADLTVKAHPALSPPAWVASLAMPPNVRLVGREVESGQWLRCATCVIAQSSTMLYQASILGRAVIVPRYDPAPPGFHLPPGDRARVVARTKTELRERIEAVLAGEGRGLAREEVAPFHPRSTQRVVCCLEAARARLSVD